MHSRVAPALLLAAAGLVGCKSDRPAAEPSPSSTAPAASPAASVAPTAITVVATDFKLQLPDTVPAGLVAMTLVNKGKELHQVQVIRLENGKTLADFEQAVKHQGPPPAWMKFVGGPNGVAPGQETSGTVALQPGRYVALCYIPGPDGVPHVMKGMVRPFEATGGSAAKAEIPAAEDTIRLVDYGFKMARPLSPGRHRILVHNDGPQPHELVLLKLQPGKTVEDFGTWATSGGMKGPPPAMPVGGVTVLDQGLSGDFTVDLTPGDYGLICFVPDAKDGKLHLVHGMMHQFKIG